MITADKNFITPGTEAYSRFLIQKEHADITSVFWGRGELLDVFKQTGTFDVVTVQDSFWRGVVGLLVSFFKHTRFNVQVHTDLDAQGIVRRLVSRFVLRSADSIRVVSEKLRVQVERVGVHVPVTVLPVFIDSTRFQSLSRKSSSQKKVILWVGRFEKEKDPLLAISVLKEVISGGVDAELILLGTGSLESVLRRRAKNLPVTFPGWRDPLPFLVSADVLLNTSRYEGYGAAIIEALAVGVPVVAPDVGVAQEAGAVITDRNTLASAVIDVLRSGARGELKIPILGEHEWGRQWLKTL